MVDAPGIGWVKGVVPQPESVPSKPASNVEDRWHSALPTQLRSAASPGEKVVAPGQSPDKTPTWVPARPAGKALSAEELSKLIKYQSEPIGFSRTIPKERLKEAASVPRWSGLWSQVGQALEEGGKTAVKLVTNYVAQVVPGMSAFLWAEADKLVAARQGMTVEELAPRGKEGEILSKRKEAQVNVGGLQRIQEHLAGKGTIESALAMANERVDALDTKAMDFPLRSNERKMVDAESCRWEELRKELKSKGEELEKTGGSEVDVLREIKSKIASELQSIELVLGKSGSKKYDSEYKALWRADDKLAVGGLRRMDDILREQTTVGGVLETADAHMKALRDKARPLDEKSDTHKAVMRECRRWDTLKEELERQIKVAGGLEKLSEGETKLLLDKVKTKIGSDLTAISRRLGDDYGKEVAGYAALWRAEEELAVGGLCSMQAILRDRATVGEILETAKGRIEQLGDRELSLDPRSGPHRAVASELKRWNRLVKEIKQKIPGSGEGAWLSADEAKRQSEVVRTIKGKIDNDLRAISGRIEDDYTKNIAEYNELWRAEEELTAAGLRSMQALVREGTTVSGMLEIAEERIKQLVDKSNTLDHMSNAQRAVKTERLRWQGLVEEIKEKIPVVAGEKQLKGIIGAVNKNIENDLAAISERFGKEACENGVMEYAKLWRAEDELAVGGLYRMQHLLRDKTTIDEVLQTAGQCIDDLEDKAWALRRSGMSDETVITEQNQWKKMQEEVVRNRLRAAEQSLEDGAESLSGIVSSIKGKIDRSLREISRRIGDEACSAGVAVYAMLWHESAAAQVAAPTQVGTTQWMRASAMVTAEPLLHVLSALPEVTHEGAE